MNRVRILGIPVDPLTQAQAVEWVAMALRDTRPRQLVSVNPERIMRSLRDPAFAAILQQADLSLADGAGVMWAAKWKKTPIPQRVPGVDFVRALAARGAREGWRFFFLGAAPGVAESAGARLASEHPGFTLAGTYPGSPTAEQDVITCERIRSSGAQVLLLAFGAPDEEIWIARNLQQAGVQVAMGVGGAFDFISGRARRAPAWMRRYGLEWLHRLRREPWRWRRMLALPRFVILVIRRGDRNGPG